MENNIEKKKGKKTALILILAIGIPVIIIIALLVVYFITRPIPVKSIKITSKITEMETGQKYVINYEILPKNATNKKVHVYEKKGIAEPTNITSKKVTVKTGTTRGQEKICIISEENEKVKACIDVYVKPEPFSERMKRFGYVNNGNGVYSTTNGNFRFDLNIYEKSMSEVSLGSGAQLNYKYYYRSGYGEAHNSSGGFNVDWFYQDSTGRATCAASSYYTTFCNYTSESSAINIFAGLKKMAEQLIDDYNDIETQT